MKKRLLYIIRHGETELNKLGIVQGSGINEPLNKKGIWQSNCFYKQYRNTNFDKIYTSSLFRTQQTVQPFLDSGYTFEPTDCLNEISWGIFEGKPQNEIERMEYWKVVNAWKSGNYHAKIMNGESALDLQKRQIKFINQLHDTYNQHSILISMHGRAMKSLLCTLLEKPLSEMEIFPHSNLCLYILEQIGSTYRIIKSNDTNHLLEEIFN